ncbi:hypothetical protein L0244_06065, partial [bacterium]|nr:hypothetical protein [bacterium]
MPFQTSNPIIDLEDSPIQLLYLQTGTAIFMASDASPEGAQFAGIGSLYISNSGTVWLKTTDLNFNTGWTPLATTLNASTRLIQSDTSAVSNTGGGLDQLHVGTAGIGSNSLQSNNDYIEFYTHGVTAANANTKRYVFGIAGFGNILDTGLVAMNALNWEFGARITRLSATIVRCTSAFITSGAPAVNVVSEVDLVVSDLNSNSVFPQSLGESGAAVTGDITETVFQAVA